MIVGFALESHGLDWNLWIVAQGRRSSPEADAWERSSKQILKKDKYWSMINISFRAVIQKICPDGVVYRIRSPIISIDGYPLYISSIFHIYIYILNMFHVFSLVCVLMYGVKSRSGHDRFGEVRVLCIPLKINDGGGSSWNWFCQILCIVVDNFVIFKAQPKFKSNF